jgi:hypothetical protein
MTPADTLGDLVLSWLVRHLPSPRDERQAFRPADWQMRRVRRWYELDADGKRCWNRVHDTDPKGKGKSPMADTMIIATESHILHQMRKAAPHKTLIGAPGVDGSCSCNNCPYMAMNTMEKLYRCMLSRSPRIEMPEPLRLAAAKPRHIHAEKNGKQEQQYGTKPATHGDTAHAATATAALTATVFYIFAIGTIQAHRRLPYFNFSPTNSAARVGVKPLLIRPWGGA